MHHDFERIRTAMDAGAASGPRAADALTTAIAALVALAEPNDKGAWDYANRTGSFALFDEPCAVILAKDALRAIADIVAAKMDA
jgi:hypothetical protein